MSDEVGGESHLVHVAWHLPAAAVVIHRVANEVAGEGADTGADGRTTPTARCQTTDGRTTDGAYDGSLTRSGSVGTGHQGAGNQKGAEQTGFHDVNGGCCTK